MTIGAVPIFHKRKKSKKNIKWYDYCSSTHFSFKKVSDEMTIGAVPIFIKQVSDEMTIGAVPIFH